MQYNILFYFLLEANRFPGGNSERVPPDPFRTQKWKRSAPMIVWGFPCESRTLPGFLSLEPDALVSVGFFFHLKWIVAIVLSYVFDLHFIVITSFGRPEHCVATNPFSYILALFVCNLTRVPVINIAITIYSFVSLFFVFQGSGFAWYC